MTNSGKTGRSSILKAVDTIRIGIWNWDVTSGEFIIDETFVRIMNYENEDLLPVQKPGWYKLNKPEKQAASKTIICHFASTKQDHLFVDFRFKHRSGQWINLQSSGRATRFDESGNPESFTGTLINISDLFDSRQHLKYRYEIEKLVAGISADFVGISHHKTDEAIRKTLEKIGRFSEIDRSYVFLLKHHNLFMHNTHEWCAPGIKPEMDNLQGLPVSIFPWWMNKLNRQEHIYIYDIADMPAEAVAEQEVLQSQEICSLLVVPIHYKKELFGFMGFDSVKKHKEWPKADIHLLETIGNIIANALNAKNNQELLIKAKEAAEESNRTKSAFLSTINHELRTPLHHILGFSDLLRSKKLPLDQTETFAGKIYDSGKNLLQIIEDILSLALTDQIDIKIRSERFKGIDLFIQHKALLEEILAMSNKQNDIELSYNPDSKFLNQVFLADKSKINQIILNLFKNAIKYTHSGKVTYSVQFDQSKKITFSVTDSGIGIPESHQETIFEYFRQVDETLTRPYNGIGVGLAISKNIAKILNGRILVESSPGEGSCFSFELPVETSSDQVPLLADDKDAVTVPDFSEKQFLIVDDDPMSVFILKNLLAPTNAELTQVDDLSFTTESLQETDGADLVLLNLKMPVENGLKLASALAERRENYPLIALSAHSLISEKEKALLAGCKAFVSKPIEPGLLFEAIKKIINP
ncbi:hybrid sensor histidine kinase/response regulator [Gaoshiqia sp. Z1-71]|uniref:hybrid sensor histidine kinase/response regulator n=1 Tax=Gaoshiqia hydrogeniformans TaxID=3290090 RepID=UPI003BF8AD51